MTNDEMRIILERALLIPIKESDAAWVLAVVEEKLRNENPPNNACNRPALAVGMQSESKESAGG